MSTIELREQLISKIQITTDEDILEGVLRFLEFETDKEETYKFSMEQKKAIADARQQVANGQYYTQEEVEKLSERWLKE